MDQVPQTSFVPRQSGSAVVQAPIRRRRRFNLLSFFAVILFFGSLILSVGVFVLKQSTEQRLAEKREELSSKRALFKRDDIESVQVLDARMKAAASLLESHVSPSKLLEVLERSTQEEIQFTQFDFERRPSGNVGVAMSGVAPRFNTIASQAKRFSDERFFKRVIFSELNKPAQQYVSFKVTVDITRDAIAYEAPVLIETSTTEEPEAALGTAGEAERDVLPTSTSFDPL